jgi:hypothetical protein
MEVVAFQTALVTDPGCAAVASASRAQSRGAPLSLHEKRGGEEVARLDG